MARIDNLNNFLSDVAAAIKEKTGLTAITPAEFDTAINSISTGIEPNGIVKDYYVAAGKTVNAGDFVEIINGVGYVGTGASKTVTIYDGEPDGGNRARAGGFRAWKINEEYVLLTFVKYIADGLFAMIGKIEYGTIILGEPMLISAMASAPKYMKLLQDNDLVVCYGNGYMSFLHYEGYNLFYLNDYTYIADGTVNAVYCENPDGTLNCMGGDTSTYSATGIKNTNIPVIKTSITFVKDDYGTYEPDEINRYKAGDSEKECANTAANPKCFSIANNYCLALNQLASTAIESGTKIGTPGVYARVMATTDGESNWDLTTIWTGTGYSKAQYFIYPGASYGWMFVREDSTTGTEADGDDYYTLKAYKLTFSGKVVSRASSPVTVSSSLREAFRNYGLTPLSSTKGLFYFESYYKPYPLSCAMLTVSSSSVAMGTITDIDFNSERMEGESNQLTPMTDSSFLFNICGYTNERYYSRPLYYSGSVITDQTQVAEYEEQVQPATSIKIAGMAKTQGTGGSATAHNEQVSVYVPNV